MSIAEIKSAIAALSEEERFEIKLWLDALPTDSWDEQMQADARSGKLATLAEEAEAEYRAGRARPFP